MAIDAAIENQSQVDQQGIADELRRDRISALRRKRNAIEQKLDDSLSLASQVANTAYTNVWERTTDILEAQAFTWPVIGVLLFAPLVSAIYIIRLFVGTFMNGGFRITWRTFDVPVIPAMKIIQIRRHALAAMMILITIGEVFLVVALMEVMADMTFATQLGLCAYFHVGCK
jgi:hypothetical protein